MPAVADHNALGVLPLFRGLPPEQLARINEQLYKRTVPSGTTLMMAEDPGEVAYIIQSGTVKVHVDQVDGSDVILALRGPGEILGEMSILDRQGRSASVVTIEECSLLRWERAVLVGALETMPLLTLNLARLLSRRLRHATDTIQSLAALDLPGRVARQILAFADEYGEPLENGALLIPLRLPQSDLAGLVGGSRERVNATMVDFKRRGYIAVDERGRIAVHDAAALARRCR
jgi:CRP/FNR family cyclic AMP-dependent transcriptional regulator